MATKVRITAERLREVLNYNPATGLFAWKKRVGRRVRVGEIAGSLNSDGYISLKVDGLRAQAHMAAWFYMTGEWPKSQLDHKDRNRSNNCWKNLRLASSSLNQANTLRRTMNTSGYKGVCWVKSRQKWEARIRVNGKVTHLGHFDCPKIAHSAYSKFARAAFGEFARVN